jgi:membrane fusion protein, copper/silver efflux system
VRNLVTEFLKKPLYLVAFLVLLTAGAFLAGSRHDSRTAAAPGAGGGRKILHYVDPMNPAHTSPKPGLAPCGMKMEPVYADDGGQGPDGLLPPGAVKINSQKQQLIGVRVATVENTCYTHALRALGKVAVDETRVYRLNASIDGWIRETYTNTTGMLVKKNEPLATFYSPDFLTAEQSFLYALGTRDRYDADKEPPQQMYYTKRNIKLAVDTLRNLGMSDWQIDDIAKKRLFADTVLIVAPATSFVIARNITPGQRFQKGFEWYQLADLSRVWVLADLYENEAQYIHPGDVVQVTYPYQKKTFRATVSEVPPIFDPASRTLKVRLELDNPDYLLRPDMFVDAEFPIKLPSTVNVPVEAVLDSGLKETVFIERGDGYFEPRKVETGWRLGDRVQILKGLQPGEKVVVSGNFLIDSESRMKLAAAGFFGNVVKDPVCGMDLDEGKAKTAGLKSEHQGKDYYFCSDQCKRQFELDPTHYLAKSTGDLGGCDHAAPGSAIQVKAVTVKDPVCGAQVEECKAKEIGYTGEYQGKLYYFCSDNCKQRFARAPEVFCGGSPGGQAQGHAAAPGLPAVSRDAVCGRDVREQLSSTAPLRTEYKGTFYFFCSEPCKEAFNKEPERYLSQSYGSRVPATIPAGEPASHDKAAPQHSASVKATEPGLIPANPPAGPPVAQPRAVPQKGGLVPGVPRTPGYDIRGRKIPGALKVPSDPKATVPGQAGEARQDPFKSHQPIEGDQIKKLATPLLKAEDIPIHLLMPPKASVAKDPVCGTNLDEAQAESMPWKSNYRDKTYFFCSEKCKSQFDKNPMHFINQAPSEAQAPEAPHVAQPGTAPGKGHQHD